jgi:UDP:flavonoid glycosyltransferase YjiC (YdhE family)
LFKHELESDSLVTHISLLQDIKEFLDNSEHGAIYFSLGSIVRTDTLAADKRDAFLQAFSELPQRVLWKWEADTLPGKPPNVKIARWLPQVDVLRKLISRSVTFLIQNATDFDHRSQ